MQQYFQVCPVSPENGVCPEPLVWVESAKAGLTLDQFHSILPEIIGVLLMVWGFRTLVKFILNNR
jgi:hypothetical protein